jgi:hypothetical protein
MSPISIITNVYSKSAIVQAGAVCGLMRAQHALSRPTQLVRLKTGRPSSMRFRWHLVKYIAAPQVFCFSTGVSVKDEDLSPISSITSPSPPPVEAPMITGIASQF